MVNVAFYAHVMARRFDPDDPVPDPWEKRREPYCESKLANILHARELARRYGDKGLRAIAVHPGFVATRFGRAVHWPGIWRLLFAVTRPSQIDAKRGAQPSIEAATMDMSARHDGLCWTPKGETKARLPAEADRAAERPWARTEELIADRLAR